MMLVTGEAETVRSHDGLAPGELLGIGACPFCGRLFALRDDDDLNLFRPPGGRRRPRSRRTFVRSCPCGASLRVTLAYQDPAPARAGWTTRPAKGLPTSRFILLSPYDGSPVEEGAVPWGDRAVILCGESLHHRWAIRAGIAEGPWIDLPCPACGSAVRCKVARARGDGELPCPGCGRRLASRWNDWGRAMTLRLSCPAAVPPPGTASS